MRKHTASELGGGLAQRNPPSSIGGLRRAHYRLQTSPVAMEVANRVGCELSDMEGLTQRRVEPVG